MSWTGCATNLYLEPGQRLLKDDPAFVKSEQQKADTTLKQRIESLKEMGLSTVDPDLLYSSVRTHPNRKMLLPKTYLHLYNLGRTLQRYEYAPERWLRFFAPQNHIIDSAAAFLVNTAGEPPVIIDSLQLERDVENLRSVYFSQGFFHAKVYYRVDTCTARVNRQKARVTYLIDEGPAAIIDKIRSTEADDPAIREVLVRNPAGSLLHTGDNYVEDNLSAERGRISAIMRENGYFTFAPKYVYFDIDTMPGDTMGTLPNNEAIKEVQPIWLKRRITGQHQVYTVGNVSMIIEPAELDPLVDLYMKVISPGMMTDSLRKAWKLGREHYSDSSKITFITYERVLEQINLNFLEKLVNLRQGETYAMSNERKTQLRLQNLGIFKYVLIKPTVDDERKQVDFQIQAVLLRRFHAKVGFEGFFQSDPILKSNLPGIGAEVGFGDKLVFKGAERLEFSAKGNLRFFTDTIASQATTGGASVITNIGVLFDGSAQASLVFPRIVAPGLARKNLQGFEPSTIFNSTFSRQQSTAYDRNAFSLDWNYRWYHSSTNKKAQSTVSPYVITLISSHLDSSIVALIRNLPDDDLKALIIQDFRQHFSSYGGYRFLYNGEQSPTRKHVLSFEGQFQMGGNTPFLIDRFTGIDDSWKDFKLGSVFYGQFLKLQGQLRNNWRIGSRAAFVMRNFVGIAKPWNYTRNVPFESRFFSGGANSMRGWQSNTLGPGTYSLANASADDTTARSGLSALLLSPGGELVFESNFELRFKVYSWIELAIFSDVGNVWFLPWSQVEFAGAKLDRTTFSQLGVDGGLGLRLDFDFFLFRVDLAQQIYAPDVGRIVVKSRRDDLGGKRFQLNFGIGYPF